MDTRERATREMIPFTRGLLEQAEMLKRHVAEERKTAIAEGKRWTRPRKFLIPVERHGVQGCAFKDCKRKSVFVTYAADRIVRAVLCHKHQHYAEQLK
jgi:hypothetical protein